MVLAAILSLVFLTVYFGKQSIVRFGDEYTIKVRFQQTPGINKNSPVFKNGVRIGRVSKVELVDDDREVEISILLPKERKIYSDEECRVRQTVIMGDASLEFVKNVRFQGAVEVIGPDSTPLVGAPSESLLGGINKMEKDITKAIGNVSDVALRMGSLVDRAGVFLGTPEEIRSRWDRMNRMMDETSATMKAVRQFSERADHFVNDPQIQQDVKKVVRSMPGILEQIRSLVDDSSHFVREGRVLMERSTVSIERFDKSLDKADTAMDTVNSATIAASADFSELMGSLKVGSRKLESFLDELTSIVQAVNDADGTIKRLMRDPEVYEKISDTIDNVRNLTGELDRMLRTDVKPIADNVKILTDKAARDPSIFIRNLLRKEPPTKGHLPIWGDGLGSDSLGDLSCGLDGRRQETILMEYGIPRSDAGILYEDIPAAPVLAPEQELDSGTPLSSLFRDRTGWGRRISSLFFPGSGSKTAVPATSSNVTETFSIDSGPERSGTPTSELAPVPPKRLVSEGRGGTEPELARISNDGPIPEGGRIVHVDPRYDMSDHAEPVYRQMSYREDQELPEPRLIFTNKKTPEH